MSVATVDGKCPHCGISQVGKPIPVHQRHLFGNETNFGANVIGVQVQGVYDGVLYWECTACKGTWHRWASPDMRALAEKHIHGALLCVEEMGFHATPHRNCILR